MIEGLDRVLEGSAQPGVVELRRLLADLLGGADADGRLIEQETLKPHAWRVVRLRFAFDGHIRAVVAKRLKPHIGRRTELLARRWLPAVGLADSGPPLLASVAESSGRSVWHLYDDLGCDELDAQHIDRARVIAATELIARIHTRFAGHALLGEIRLHGGDLGVHFYESNVRDAIYALSACRGNAEQQDVRDRLLKRLYALRDDLPYRARRLSERGGPETLLHGDLWTINIFVGHATGGLRARLIDWDHAAVGPVSYDLSTFLLRLPREHRSWVLNAYRQQLATAGWSLPDDRELNALFETAEYARFANRIIWPAIAIAEDKQPWGWEALSEIDEWFEHFEPVLALDRDAARNVAPI